MVLFFTLALRLGETPYVNTKYDFFFFFQNALQFSNNPEKKTRCKVTTQLYYKWLVSSTVMYHISKQEH